MSADVVCRILFVSARPVHEFDVVWHESKTPSLDSGCCWVSAVDYPEQQFVVGDQFEWGSLHIQVEMFDSIDSSEHFSVRL